jgi:hypothetical protein
MLFREIIAAYCEIYIWIRDRSLEFVVCAFQTHSKNYVFRRIHRITNSACWHRHVYLAVLLSVFSAACPHGTTSPPLSGFSLNCYLRIFRKSVKKIQASWISDKNTLCFTWGPTYPCDNTSLKSSWNDKYFRKISKETQNTFYVPWFLLSTVPFMR